MKLRKQRRRTIREMRWRHPVWIAWSEVGIDGEPTGNGGFKFTNLRPESDYLIQWVVHYDEAGEPAVAQIVPM